MGCVCVGLTSVFGACVSEWGLCFLSCVLGFMWFAWVCGFGVVGVVCGLGAELAALWVCLGGYFFVFV